MKWMAILCVAWHGEFHVERIHDIVTKEGCVAFVENFNKRLSTPTSSTFGFCVPEDRSSVALIQKES